MSEEKILSTIKAIWIEEMDVPPGEHHKIRPESDFLAIGGDSMKFVRVIARLEDAFSISIDEQEMQKMLTLNAQAAYVQQALGAAAK